MGIAVPEQHFQGGIAQGHGPQFTGVETVLVHRGIHDPGNAKVEDLDPAVSGDKHIVRLEVRVHQAVFVRVGEAAGHLLDQGLVVRFLAFGELDVLETRQGVTLQHLHGHVDPVAIAVEVVHGQHIGMRELLRFFRLPLQADQGLGMTTEFFTEKLDRDPGIVVVGLFLAQVTRLVDLAHAALAEPGLQHEAVLDDIAGVGHVAAPGQGRRAGMGIDLGAVLVDRPGGQLGGGIQARASGGSRCCQQSLVFVALGQGRQGIGLGCRGDDGLVRSVRQYRLVTFLASVLPGTSCLCHACDSNVLDRRLYPNCWSPYIENY